MKVLFLTQIWPEKQASGASTRTLQLIEFFIEKGWNVQVWSDAESNLHMQQLCDWGCETTRIGPNDSNFDLQLLKFEPTVVVFDRFSIEEKFSFRVRAHCPNALRILDTVDFHSLRIARENEIRERPHSDLCCTDFELARFVTYASGIWERELALILRSDLSLVVSDFEHQLLVSQFKVPESLLHFCRMYCEVRSEPLTAFEKRSGFVAMGSFLHPPNLDSVKFLCSQFWPKLRAKLPNARLKIFGSHLNQKHRSQISLQPGITLEGYAESAADVMNTARVHLALVRYGAGIKSKLCDAFLGRIPSVTTPVGAEGMTDGSEFPGFVCSNLEEAVESAVALHQEKETWESKAALCDSLLQKGYNKEILMRSLATRLDAALAHLHENRSANLVGNILWHQSHRSTEYFSKWIETKQQLNHLQRRGFQ